MITDSPRHRFHCDDATHTFENGTHAFLVRMRDASRSPLALVRKPAKSEFPEYLLLAVIHAVETNTTKQQARTRATEASSTRVESVEAGRERRTPLAGYRESATQIMMSKVDRTNALYYVVNVPNNLSRSPNLECCTVSFLIVTDEYYCYFECQIIFRDEHAILMLMILSITSTSFNLDDGYFSRDFVTSLEVSL